MQSTEGSYEGHRVMLEAANEGANPSAGPLDRSFTVGNTEIPMRSEYMRMQAAQMCGRLQTKIEGLRTQHWNLAKYKGLLEIAEAMRGNLNVDPAAASSRNPVPGRNE